jgi:F-type H+-transporting ATPase subunit b
VRQIIAERQAAARAILDDARAAREAAVAARDAARVATEDIAARRADALASARDEADVERQRIVDAARAEAERLRAESVADLARVRHTEARRLEDQASVLAAEIAGKLLAQLPEEARIAGFIDGLVTAVAELPEASRSELAADGPVRVRAARSLSEAERTALSERLGAVLGRAPELEIEPEPALLAGLELVTPHAIVRNHFRADLDRIRKRLTSHD